MNISSSSDPLLAALTNPTELAKRKGNLRRSYPVVDTTGKRWADSEAAYKACKSGDTQRDERVMVRIIAAKLKQHPELVAGIALRGDRRKSLWGDVSYLECCDHLVGVRGSRWEGRGRESRFIRCLIAAFERSQL